MFHILHLRRQSIFIVDVAFPNTFAAKKQKLVCSIKNEVIAILFLF